MSRTRQHTHRSDTNRNAVAKDARNTARRREDMFDAADARFVVERAEEPETRELTVEEIDAGYLPAARVFEFNPNRYEFCWNDDFSGFIPCKLRWWDDASYAAYQADCGEDEESYRPDCGDRETEVDHEAAEYDFDPDAADAWKRSEADAEIAAERAIDNDDLDYSSVPF